MWLLNVLTCDSQAPYQTATKVCVIIFLTVFPIPSLLICDITLLSVFFFWTILLRGALQVIIIIQSCSIS